MPVPYVDDTETVVKAERERRFGLCSDCPPSLRRPARDDEGRCAMHMRVAAARVRRQAAYNPANRD